MLRRSKRSSRSVDYLLSTLSPLEVSRSTRAYLTSLDENELSRLVERSVARMDDDERAYYALSGDFATFLEQNRRALRTLDHDALRAILMPVIVARSAQVEGTEDESLRSDELSSTLRAALPPVSPARAWRGLMLPLKRRASRARAVLVAIYREMARAPRRAWPTFVRIVGGIATACAVVGAGAAIAFLLVSIVVPAGKAGMAWMSAHPFPHAALATNVQRLAAAPVLRHRAVPAPQRRVAAVKPATPKPATPKPATPEPSPRQTSTPAPTHIAARRVHPPKRRRIVVASSPKHIGAPLVAGAMPSHEPALVQRARLIVMSYLDSLMRGDASSALGNLGLSASAGTSNLTEAPILAGATEFRVVRARLTDPTSAKVQVVIDSPQGRFFGDYIVSANGPAAWITQHEVIPVESTVARHR